MVVDFTTGRPDAARALAADLAGRGVRYVDAPVSGSIAGAREGALIVWVGAAADDVGDASARLVDTLGDNVFHLGAVGLGTAMKLCNQVVHILTVAAIGEGVALARGAGVDPDKAVASMLTSSADSAMLRRFGNAIAEEDFAPEFTLALAAKDLRFANTLSESLGLDLTHPCRALADVRERQNLGLGDLNFTAMEPVARRLGRLTGRRADARRFSGSAAGR